MAAAGHGECPSMFPTLVPHEEEPWVNEMIDQTWKELRVLQPRHSAISTVPPSPGVDYVGRAGPKVGPDTLY